MKDTMKKKRITYSFLFAALVFVLCTAQTCGPGPDYTSRVPCNSVPVV
jgi:hypothetical protein